MFIEYCLYFVMFTIQLFKSMCHPNHCIHHSAIIPSFIHHSELPPSIQNIKSISNFKKKIKMYLLTKEY